MAMSGRAKQITVADAMARIAEFEIEGGRRLQSRAGRLAGKLSAAAKYISPENLDRLVAYVIRRWYEFDFKQLRAFWMDTPSPRWESILSTKGLAVLARIFCEDPDNQAKGRELINLAAAPADFVKRANEPVGTLARKNIAEYREGESRGQRARRTRKLRDKKARKKRERRS